MKKIIGLMVITITAVTINTIDARIARQKPVTVTHKSKQMLTDAKALQVAQTPEDQAKSALKLAKDIQNDQYAQLKIEEKRIQQDIKNKTEEIAQAGGGYFSYFDNDDLAELKNELNDLNEELIVVQEQLKVISGTQTKVETRLKDWAVYTLIAAVTLGIADQLITGGTGRSAIVSGATTAGSTAANKAKALWEYLQTNSESVPTEGSSSIGSLAISGATAAVGIAASIAAAELKALLIRKSIDTAMSFIAGADEDTDKDQLQKAQENAVRLTEELNATNAHIQQLKEAQLEEQVTQQRNV